MEEVKINPESQISRFDANSRKNKKKEKYLTVLKEDAILTGANTITKNELVFIRIALAYSNIAPSSWKTLSKPSLFIPGGTDEPGLVVINFNSLRIQSRIAIPLAGIKRINNLHIDSLLRYLEPLANVLERFSLAEAYSLADLIENEYQKLFSMFVTLQQFLLSSSYKITITREAKSTLAILERITYALTKILESLIILESNILCMKTIENKKRIEKIAGDTGVIRNFIDCVSSLSEGFLDKTMFNGESLMLVATIFKFKNMLSRSYNSGKIIDIAEFYAELRNHKYTDTPLLELINMEDTLIGERVFDKNKDRYDTLSPAVMIVDKSQKHEEMQEGEEIVNKRILVDSLEAFYILKENDPSYLERILKKETDNEDIECIKSLESKLEKVILTYEEEN